MLCSCLLLYVMISKCRWGVNETELVSGRVDQVPSGTQQRLRIITNMTKKLVARPTQDPSNLAGRVIMIDS